MQGSWQLPGGWVHFAESPEQAVQRKLTEFSGLTVGSSQFVTYTSNVFDPATHSISLYFMLECIHENHQKLVICDKKTDWLWVDWNNLPHPLFLPLQLLKKTGFNPFNE